MRMSSFVDAVHPQHNPVLGCGRIKRGEDHEFKSNTGRCVNINGMIDQERLEPMARFDDAVDATSTIALLQQLEQVYSVATWIYVICDSSPSSRLCLAQRNDDQCLLR
jgi:hypothetical protein